MEINSKVQQGLFIFYYTLVQNIILLYLKENSICFTHCILFNGIIVAENHIYHLDNWLKYYLFIGKMIDLSKWFNFIGIRMNAELSMF